jgi:hypothetical protein
MAIRTKSDRFTAGCMQDKTELLSWIVDNFGSAKPRSGAHTSSQWSNDGFFHGRCFEIIVSNKHTAFVYKQWWLAMSSLLIPASNTRLTGDDGSSTVNDSYIDWMSENVRLLMMTQIIVSCWSHLPGRECRAISFSPNGSCSNSRHCVKSKIGA